VWDRKGLDPLPARGQAGAKLAHLQRQPFAVIPDGWQFAFHLGEKHCAVADARSIVEPRPRQHLARPLAARRPARYFGSMRPWSQPPARSAGICLGVGHGLFPARYSTRSATIRKRSAQCESQHRPSEHPQAGVLMTTSRTRRRTVGTSHADLRAVHCMRYTAER
jgi:hypothetical protein